MRNHRLDRLQPYPFQRLNQLLEPITPADQSFISLAMGEPKHPAAEFLKTAYANPDLITRGFATYPPTKGLPELREAIAEFLKKRFELESIDPETQTLPVTGTREGLFAIAQALIDPANPGLALMPNPFYQIYEGAAILAGSEPYYMNCSAEQGFLPDLDQLSPETLDKCEVMFLCTPGNPSGAVMPITQLQQAIGLAIKHNFVVVSDECYSEIYQDEENPPPGLLQAAAAMGNESFEHCITFNSLSKRSNLPGLRSGYVAGHKDLIEQFLLYRTYHGSAMSVHNQLISVQAWQDEQHVIENRALYRDKYTSFHQAIAAEWPMEVPDASFYLWPEVPGAFENDEVFTKRLIAETNIKVLPGSYLSRTNHQGINPGAGRVRMALVATPEECLEGAHRIVEFIRNS